MAKVGNEVKLILRLAKERGDKSYHDCDGQDKQYSEGYQHGLRIYSTILLDIVDELEKK